MRHVRSLDESSYSKVNVAAVWPASPLVAPVPVPDIEEPERTQVHAPTAAAPDVPAAVGRIIVAAYASLIAAFAFAAAGSPESIYVITISALFVVTFFSVPRIFLKVEPRNGGGANFYRFMRDGMQTFTGHCTGAAALVQMLIVPVLLTLAALVMGVAAAVIM
jgi:hypothetical protein